MEFEKVINSRRSIRKFKPDPVPDAYITELLKAARFAPSAMNIQSTRFVVLKTPEAVSQLKGYTLPFVTKAPLIFVCCADIEAVKSSEARHVELVISGALQDNPEDKMIIDGYYKNRSAGIAPEESSQNLLWTNAAIAVDHMTLKAADLGLGSCWVGFLDREGVKKKLALGDGYEVLFLLPVGYPDQNPPQRPRIPQTELVIKEL